MEHLQDLNRNHISAMVLKPVTENKACNYMEVSISEAVQLHLILSFAIANMEIVPLNHVDCVFLKIIVISYWLTAFHWNEEVGQQT